MPVIIHVGGNAELLNEVVVISHGPPMLCLATSTPLLDLSLGKRRPFCNQDCVLLVETLRGLGHAP